MEKSASPRVHEFIGSPAINWALVAILLIAAFLRLYRLSEIPPGLTHDEADTGHFFAAVYRGEPSPVEAPYGYAYEPLPMVTGALFMHLFGPNDLALRLHSAFFGLMLLVFTYLWARRLFGLEVGLGSAALIGFSFWTVSDSRFALNSQPAPALLTGAAYFLWLALDGEGDERQRLWAWGPFALLLAGSLYVYEAARSAAMAFVLLLIHLACFDRLRFRRHGAWLAGALVVAGTLAAPHLLDPGAWGRTSTLAGPLQAAAQGDFGPLQDNVLSAVGTLSVRGDSFVTYNLPGRPIFDPVVSIFFYGGVALCLWRWRRPTYAFVLMWLMAGMLPTLALGEYTSTLHSKTAEAPIMTLPAIGALEFGRWVTRRFGRHWGQAFAAGCAAWLVVVAALTGCDYFARWGQAPATRAAYFHNLAAVTDYLNQEAPSGVVTLSSPFPDLPLDPFIADMRVHRDDVSLRWCDARRAIVFPDATHSLFILPPSTPLDPHLADRLDLRLMERVHLRPDDVDPYFDVFNWNPNDALASFVASSAGTVIMTAGEAPLRPPVNFGDAVDLLSYHLSTPDAAPGETMELITTWRIRDPSALGPPPPRDYGHALVIFVHALDPTDTVVGQEDRLDAPTWNWHAGDAFAQIHRFQIAPDAPPGPYRLELGIYKRHDLARLPVSVDGAAVDHRVLLTSTEIPPE